MPKRPQIPPAINGTEQRLDALLDEFRALRAELRPGGVSSSPADGAVELRESAPSRRRE